jgi:hypothetical protein
VLDEEQAAKFKVELADILAMPADEGGKARPADRSQLEGGRQARVNWRAAKLMALQAKLRESAAAAAAAAALCLWPLGS